MIWQTKKLGDVLEYEQPSKYIVKSTKYSDDYDTPVLTAGKSFILGKTREKEGIFPENKLPVIIFDDFTTATKFVDFPFKVKSSAMKILHPVKDISDARFLFYVMQSIEFDHTGVHKRYWISEYSTIEISLPSLPEQRRIVKILDEIFEKTEKAKENAEKNLQNSKKLFESYLQSVFTKSGKSWEDKRLDEICDLITCGVAATPKYVDESEGVPFLSAQNVRDGEVVLDKYRHISKQFHQELTKKNKPAKGDILYSRVGSKFGEAGVVEHEFEFSVYVSLTLIKPKFDKLDSYYLKHYLNSPIIKSLAKKSISSSGVPNLNVKDVREFPVKCPPIATQKIAVNQIKILSAETKKLEAIYKQKLADLEELKKSVLKKAFSGEL